MKQILALTTLFLLLGACTSTPSRNVYFRIRPPTSEAPSFHKDGKFGMKFELENQRFVVNPTNNLVDNFNFDTRNFYNEGQGNGKDLSGFDLSASYTKHFFSTPFEFSLSTDFVRLKVLLLDLRDKDIGFILAGNIGSYSSVFYTTSGNAGSFLNFESDGGAKSKSIENQISVSGSGRETKYGGSLGYYFAKSAAVYAAYNKYGANLTANATRSTTGQEISFNDSVTGDSTGLGILWSMGSDHIVMSLSADSVNAKWGTQELSKTVIQYEFNLEF